MSLRTHLNLGLITAGAWLLSGCASSPTDKGADVSNASPTAVKESHWYKPDWLSLPSWKIFGGEETKPQPKVVAAKKTIPAAKDASAEAWNEPKAKPSNPEVSKDAAKPKPVALTNSENKPKTETTVAVKTAVTVDFLEKFGWFLEIEGQPRSIKKIEKKLGLQAKDLEKRSYLQMMFGYKH